jgi:TPP-dependent pyruvate/acetoin dehydrogenase alpha subunit
MSSDREESISEPNAREMLTEMVRIRRFEDRISESFAEGDIPGFMHVSNGHEASHVGIGMAREPGDWWTVGGARVNGQALAAGVQMDELAAEILGKVTGPNRGKGGHMHVSNVDINLYGSAATIGQSPNPATGIALAQEMRETGQASISVLGDGGTTRGTFHTALNLASVWDLPVVFVIENNRFALSFSTEDRIKPENLSEHAERYGITGVTVDGSEVETVYETVSDALSRAKSGGGPTLIEHKLHRLEGHYVGDKEQYRQEDIDEIREEWDPVSKYRDTLVERGWLTHEEYDNIVETVDEEVDAALEFAASSDFPDPAEAYDDCYRRPLYGQEE